MRNYCFFLILFFPLLSFGQKNNLVPNPSFEQYIKCPTGYGQVDSTMYWTNYHFTPDFFHVCSSNENVSVPKNFFGYQEPVGGKGYAGLMTYHEESDNEIIGVKLLKSLVQGKKYEARIKVSLSEVYSKYASNNIGFLFTNKPEEAYEGKEVHFKTDKVITETKEWITIAGTFIADKNYAYMMIGNFFSREETTIQPTHVSTGYNVSYYFIDDVYVGEVGVRKSFSSTETFEAGDIFVLDNVYFDFDKYSLKSTSTQELNRLLSVLQKHPKISIEVSGHTDAVGTEAKNQILSENRAKAVYNYLIKNGINANRLSYKGYGELQPIDSNETAEGRAINRRVEVKVVK